MEAKLKKISETQVEVDFELTQEEFKKYIDCALEHLQEHLEVNGFRKGQIPKGMVEEKAGKENVLAGAADMAVKDNYFKTIFNLAKENKFESISQPQIEVVKLAQGDSFQFKAKVSTLPEIKLPDYKKIAAGVKKNKTEVTDKEMEDAMKWFQKSRAKFTFKNEPAQKGDFVEIEYWSPEIEGVANPKGIKDGFILGEGGFIPGFEDCLAGMKAGQEKDKIFLKIPEKNHSNSVGEKQARAMAGKEINLKIKMNSVQKIDLPELSDEFIKQTGKFENLETFKKSVKDGIFFEKEQIECQKIRSEILDRVSQKTEFEIPEVLVSEEQKRMIDDAKREIEEHLKTPFKDYLEKIKKSEKELFDSFMPKAKDRVKKFLLLREIGKSEKIGITEAEIEEEINKTLKRYPDIKTAEKEVDPVRSSKEILSDLIFRDKSKKYNTSNGVDPVRGSQEIRSDLRFRDKSKKYDTSNGVDLGRLKEYTKEVIRNEKIFKMLENLSSL